ncbi:MAG: hypothetical protein AAF585_10105 [Verrucomicrobiota bacterium]
MNHPVHRHFKHIYLIAIPSRRERALSVMSEMGIQPKVFEATLREDLPSLPDLLAKRVVTARFFLNLFPKELVGVPSIADAINDGYFDDRPEDLNAIRGKIALHQTRLKLCAEFLKSGDRQLILFEDDLAAPSDLDRHQSAVGAIFDEEAPDDWDVVNLGRCFDCCSANADYSKHLVTETAPFCAHALALSRAAAERIVDRTQPMYHSGDAMFRDALYLDPQLRCFASKEALFHQDRESLTSTLGNNQARLPECVEGMPQRAQLAKDFGVPAF